ncbi:hypothetical protein OG948_32880 [Embleya sp. NBC_00888]|uniref:hypothetical protein n=1 Tax=Embleya sp. NBC_00888 TaxID=2975960 RepID=UPI003868A02B|nr:hypothetical protein OG948_32880 [Embleya sp. NBC_00888]
MCDFAPVNPYGPNIADKLADNQYDSEELVRGDFAWTDTYAIGKIGCHEYHPDENFSWHSACTLTDKEWEWAVRKWATDKTNNPYGFLGQPIEWIRFEMSQLATEVLSWWLKVDPPFTGGQDRGASGITGMLRSHTIFITTVVAVLSLLWVAGKMALSRNPMAVGSMVKAMFTLVVVTTSSIAFFGLLLTAGHTFTQWFLIRGLSGRSDTAINEAEVCNSIQKYLEVTPMGSTDRPINFALFLLSAILLIIAGVMLYLYMLARLVGLTLLLGIMPVFAAGSGTETGKAALKKCFSFAIGFALLEPTAAFVIVPVFRMWANPEDGSTAEGLASVIILAAGTLSLPATMRMVNPLVGLVAEDGKGAHGAVMGTLAMGAKGVAALGAVVATGGTGAAAAMAKGAGGGGGRRRPPGPPANQQQQQQQRQQQRQQQQQQQQQPSNPPSTPVSLVKQPPPPPPPAPPAPAVPQPPAVPANAPINTAAKFVASNVLGSATGLPPGSSALAKMAVPVLGAIGEYQMNQVGGGVEGSAFMKEPKYVEPRLPKAQARPVTVSAGGPAGGAATAPRW